MRMVAFALSLLFLSPAAPAAVSKLGKDAICKTEDAALVKDFDPSRSYSSDELQKIVQISSTCPDLKLPEKEARLASQKLAQALFFDKKAQFESNFANANWDFLRRHAQAAGYSDEELQKLMAPYLERAKSDCAPRDQRTKLPPVWNQGNQGWCYGYAAAGIVSYILQEPVSPDGVSMHYSIRNSWNGGNTLEALELSRQHGFCRAEEVPFSNDLQASGYSPILNGGTEIRDLAREFFTISGQRRAAMAEDSACRDLLTPMALDLAASLKLTSTELVYVLEKAADDNMVKRYLGEECVPIKKPLKAEFRNILLIDPQNPIKVASYEKDSDYPQVTAEEARRQLQAALRADKVVGVSTFDSSVIGAGDRNHAMVIVGQEWNEKTRQCDVILRNSWGPFCMPGTDDNVACDGKGNYSVPIGKVLKHRFAFTLY
jgi:hypothetical protein